MRDWEGGEKLKNNDVLTNLLAHIHGNKWN